MSSINLEVGKYYRARNGMVFGPTKYDHDTITRYVFDAGHPDGGRHCFTMSGSYFASDSQSEYDLVEEVPGPCALKAALGEMEAAAQAEQQADNVNRPSHYTAGEIECIDAIRASMSPEEFQGFCKGNAQKYLWRFRHKGGAEDLAKADWYLQRLRQAVA